MLVKIYTTRVENHNNVRSSNYIRNILKQVRMKLIGLYIQQGFGLLIYYCTFKLRKTTALDNKVT